MKKFNIFLIALLFTALFCSCKDDSLGQKNTETIDRNTVSGTITFAGEQFVTGTDGTYQIAAFENWPPVGRPSSSAELNIYKDGDVNKAKYKLHNLGIFTTTSYIIAVGWVPKNYRAVSPVLGIYGCDTARYENCSSSGSWLKIENSQGLENINIICWADTSKRINVPY